MSYCFNIFESLGWNLIRERRAFPVRYSRKSKIPTRRKSLGLIRWTLGRGLNPRKYRIIRPFESG